MTANRALRSSQVVNIEDLCRLAQRRLPKSVFDYLDGGAEAESTLTENCRAFRDVTFRPRGAVAIADCNLKTKVLGHELSFPALLAPVGYSRLMHPGGEVAAARAAGLVGTGYILSTISGHKLENVKAASQGPVWYQLYLLGGREAAEGALDRARRAGFAVVVSNHGGRQLDSVSPSLRALPEVIGAVNGQTEVLMDGGIRRGSDIVKAICLGARAVLIGRAYAYGLAAAGQTGVARALEILRGEVERTLRLLGCPSVAALDRSYVETPHAWSVR
jgi:L-lactate dehydrogenase (cytochrome)